MNGETTKRQPQSAKAWVDDELRRRFQKDTDLWLRHFPVDSKDTQYMVIKSQLIIERLIAGFVEGQVKRPEQLEGADLSYRHWLAFARALLPSDTKTWVWGQAKKLNGLRNMLAHNLEPRNFEVKLDEFIRAVAVESKDGYETKVGLTFLEAAPNLERHVQLSIALMILFQSLSIEMKYDLKRVMQEFSALFSSQDTFQQ